MEKTPFQKQKNDYKTSELPNISNNEDKISTRTNSARIQRVDAKISKAFKTAASVGASEVEALSMLRTVVELTAGALVKIWNVILMKAVSKFFDVGRNFSNRKAILCAIVLTLRRHCVVHFCRAL